MTQWQVDLEVWLKPSVFDPQGHAVLQALQSLGHGGVAQVRVGKSMAIAMTGDTRQAVEAEVRKMCDTVLCNGVMETYEIVRIEPADAGAGAAGSVGSVGAEGSR
ncbi:phosphoribosylformylglycinamidine synthase subunit PurS [Alicyclobacillus sp. ALC3]|uniref:phosphoribosylformylglycinamidine synthase subunit PurS n=1 Tax=Alicyclobacillus sp. ALC3 TaxID=2796143 RepID=UPI0023785D4D|nr:phosphoribosylformylglycinamidine synthase subunit PurS [Alicyclobacillus sp. ALC3]WDL95482.1 phosphoribosylformylglycinamidine synthase subunit PurS [Alicyclobacillus sp. ALC3]